VNHPATAALAGTPPVSRPADRADRAFFGHPVGLGWLAACELWERFSFYGMQALLVLYLTNTLVGWLAGLLETMPGRDFWSLHAALVAAAGLLLLGVRFAFGRLLIIEGADEVGGVAPRRR
jgi:dipeptide/tripeptide permease